MWMPLPYEDSLRDWLFTQENRIQWDSVSVGIPPGKLATLETNIRRTS